MSEASTSAPSRPRPSGLVAVRYLGAAAVFVNDLGRLVQPDEVVEVPRRLAEQLCERGDFVLVDRADAKRRGKTN